MLYPLLVFLYYFIPIWGLLIWKWVPLHSRYLLIVAAVAAYIGAVYFAFNPIRLKAITGWIHYYFLFLMVYMAAFSVKYRRFNHVLALSLWTLFIVGDVWEWPLMVYDGAGYLGLLPLNHVLQTYSIQQWFASHIHRLYVFATAILMFQVAGLQFSRKLAYSMVGVLAACFVLLNPFWKVGGTSGLAGTLARLLTLGVIALLVLKAGVRQ